MSSCKHVDELHALLATLHLTRDTAATPSVSPLASVPRPSTYDFKSLLDEALKEINALPLKMLDKETKDAIRDLLEELRDLNILPSAIAYTRGYFCEMAYYRENDAPQRRFIRKALDCLYRQQGFARGLDDPNLCSVKQEIESKLSDFYSVHAAVGWQKSGSSSSPDAGDAALQLSKLLIRLFLAEGLGVQILEAFKSYEKLIYFANDRYRDHYVHVVYCFLLGCRILDAFMPQLHALRRQYSGEDISRDDHYVRTMRSWLVAGLLHDVGYAAQILKDLRNKMQEEFFNHIPGFKLTDLHLDKERYIREATNASLALVALVLKENEYCFDPAEINAALRDLPGCSGSETLAATSALLHDQLEALDHGVVSALFLLLTLTVDTHEVGWDLDLTGAARSGAPNAVGTGTTTQEHRENFQKRRKDITHDIIIGCHAIALHNMRQAAYKGLSVKFTEHPIAWLLMLCDDLQEWDRSHETENSTSAMRAVYGFDVIRRVARPDDVFKKKVTVKNDEELVYSAPTMFGYLCERVRQWEGKDLDSSGRAELEQTARWLESEIPAGGGTDGASVRRHLEQRLSERVTRRTATKPILRTALLSLTNDVITLTYVGGGPDMSPNSRIGWLHVTLKTLFEKNLTEGPAICVLQGEESHKVSLFFVAEYDRMLREYKILT